MLCGAMAIVSIDVLKKNNVLVAISRKKTVDGTQLLYQFKLYELYKIKRVYIYIYFANKVHLILLILCD